MSHAFSMAAGVALALMVSKVGDDPRWSAMIVPVLLLLIGAAISHHHEMK